MLGVLNVGTGSAVDGLLRRIIINICLARLGLRVGRQERHDWPGAHNFAPLPARFSAHLTE